MPEIALGEILFILMMFLLVTIISIVSFYLFFKQYKKEMAANRKAKEEKNKKIPETE